MRFREDLREIPVLQVWRAHLAVQDTAGVHETGGACTAPEHLQGCIYHISPNTPWNFVIFVAFFSVCVHLSYSGTFLCTLALCAAGSVFRACLRRVLNARLMRTRPDRGEIEPTDKITARLTQN